MKKNFKFYALIWVILLAAFNAVVFLVRPVIPGFVIHYDARFWIAWAFILAAFIGNLVCAYLAFRAETPKKLFYHLSLIAVSRTALVIMLIVGCALMLIPNCPEWIAAIVCLLVLAFHAVATVKAAWAVKAVERVDEKVKAQTFFVRALTVDAQNLSASAKSEAARAACKKVYEAVRYADPMSSEMLAGEENAITLKFGEFSSAVAGDADTVAPLADELVVLIGNRNRKCKLLK